MGYNFGGIERLELDWFKYINKNIKFDFLTCNEVPFKNYELEINKLGGKVYNFQIVRNNLKNKIIYAYRLYKFLKSNNYDIIHINTLAFFFSFHVVVIAKICKVKKIIVHSHSPLEKN